jgi:hypothetical protein
MFDWNINQEAEDRERRQILEGIREMSEEDDSWESFEENVTKLKYRVKNKNS